MCQILGSSFNTEVSYKHILPEFQELSLLNPDGWGISLYPEGQLMLSKDSMQMCKSPKAMQLMSRSDLKSKIMLAHVRAKNNSIISDKDSHPFSVLYEGKHYSYVHNCGVTHDQDDNFINSKSIKPRHFFPDSGNAAEKIFCYVMDELKVNQITEWNKDSFEFLNKTFLELNNNRFLNALMTEGENVFVYSSCVGYGMYAVHRDINTKEIQTKKTKTTHRFTQSEDHEEGWLFSTSKLTDENWVSLEAGKLHVFNNGIKIF